MRGDSACFFAVWSRRTGYHQSKSTESPDTTRETPQTGLAHRRESDVSRRIDV